MSSGEKFILFCQLLWSLTLWGPVWFGLVHAHTSLKEYSIQFGRSKQTRSLKVHLNADAYFSLHHMLTHSNAYGIYTYHQYINFEGGSTRDFCSAPMVCYMCMLVSVANLPMELSMWLFLTPFFLLLTLISCLIRTPMSYYLFTLQCVPHGNKAHFFSSSLIDRWLRLYIELDNKCIFFIFVCRWSIVADREKV